MTRTKWVFDTGGAGRGAWVGGAGYALTKLARERNCLPDVVMGASIGAYMAANAASGDADTFLKGWSDWGAETRPPPSVTPAERGILHVRDFRAYLKHSLAHVFDSSTIDRVFHPDNPARLIVCTAQLVRRDGASIDRGDISQLLLQAVMRKTRLKIFLGQYAFRAVLFDSRAHRVTEVIKPLTKENLLDALMGACLIPMAMGMPMRLDGLNLLDGGYCLKVPLHLPPEPAYEELERDLITEKTVVITTDPNGVLWTTTMRWERWNDRLDVQRALRDGTLLVIHPTAKVKAGTLCRDNRIIMDTFWAGAARAEQVMGSEQGKRFF